MSKKEKTDLDEAFTGTCENCRKENVKVRRIEAKGMFGETRGYYNICFECIGPQITFKSRGRTFTAPMRKREGK